MFNRCGIMRGNKAAPQALLAPMESRLINLCRRFFAMSESYHIYQLPLNFSSFEHITPECDCGGKRCSKCTQVKCINAFTRARANKDGRCSWCRDCARVPRKAYNDAHRGYLPRNIASRHEYARLKHSDHFSAFESNVCAICKQPESRKRHLALDHDHATGNIRGFLCSRCNIGLGFFRDDISYLGSAIEYLRYWQDRKEDTH